MTNPAQIAATCQTCLFAAGIRCHRDGDYLQSYETQFDDDDFCGPDRRYYRRRTFWRWVRQALSGKEQTDGE